MSTRSTISLKHKDGTIESIYCHFDGYLLGVGNILYNCYKSYKKVFELVCLGNISRLDELPENSVSYFRDMGEKFDSKLYLSIEEYEQMNYQDYNYLFKNNKWYYAGFVIDINSKVKCNYFELESYCKEKINEQLGRV